MSARVPRGAAPFLAAVALLLPTSALALDFPYLFADPLRTMPAVVEKGVVLPGDVVPFTGPLKKDFTRPLALSEAVDLALSNNPKIKSAWADIKIEAGAIGEAYAAYFPTLSATTNWTLDDLRLPGASSETSAYSTQASLNWRIFDFGSRPAGRHAAENLLAAALASHDATVQDALTGVVQAYFDAMTAGASVTAKTRSEEIARDTLNSAKAREAKGVVSQSDTLRAATSLARASLDKNRAYGDYQKALAVLRRVIGLPGDTPLSMPKEMGAYIGVQGKELRNWLEDAQKSHPAIVAARKQLEAAKQQVIVTRAAGLPTVNLSGNYYQNTRPGQAVVKDSTETTVIIGITFPLFDGFASTYKLRGAQAQVEKKQAGLADVEQQVALGIIKAYADATSSLSNLESSAALLEAAQSALAVSQRKYDKGAADITEVLSTQSDLVDAWNQRVRALAEWHSARLQLLANVGKMGRTAVAD